MEKKINRKELVWRILSTGVGVLLTDIIIEKYFENNFWIGLIIVCIICTVFEIFKYFVKAIIDNLKGGKYENN